MRDAEGLIAPARERSLGKVRLKVHTADAQKVVHGLPVIVKHMRQGAGKGAAGRVVIPAHGRAANLDIDHRHGKLRQKRSVAVPVMDPGPVRRLSCDMVIRQTKLNAIALKGEQQIAHKAGICPAVVSGRHIAEGMDGEHVIRRVSALVPRHHAGHIGVGKVRVHLRQIPRIIQAERNLRRHEVILVRAVRVPLHVLSAEWKPGALSEIALFLKQIPDAPRHMSPVPIIANKVYGFHSRSLAFTNCCDDYTGKYTEQQS